MCRICEAVRRFLICTCSSMDDGNESERANEVMHFPLEISKLLDYRIMII